MPLRSGRQRAEDTYARPRSRNPEADAAGWSRKTSSKKNVGETKDYMARVADLVHEYVPPDPEKIQAAAAAGSVSVTKATPITIITIKIYLKSRDAVTVGFDVSTKAIASYNVDSNLDSPKDDPVKLAVTFARLPDGTNYAQQSVLTPQAKRLKCMFQIRTTRS